MKKIKHSVVFTLSALSAALMCQTATIYASDIEIYKAPTTGGASLMMVLDRSNSMRQDYFMPINTDFGLTRDDCGVETTEADNKYLRKDNGGAWFTDTVNYTYKDDDDKTHLYNFTGNFCYIDKSRVTNSFGTAAQRAALIRSCKELNTTDKWLWKKNNNNWYRQKETVASRAVYKCPDRLTMLQSSLYNLIGDKDKLSNTSAIGFTKFPDMSLVQGTTLLNDTGRKTLLSKVADFSSPGGGTPIAAAYSVGAKNLHEYMSTAERACAGFGVYMLTDGDPASENLTTARSSTNLNKYLTSDNQLKDSNCSNSWSCVETAAGFLVNKKNTYGNEVKTAVVGFGGDFSFRNSSGATVPYLSTYNADAAANLFTGANQKAAARAAAIGKGGWFSAENTEDIVGSVQNFVNSIKIPIPAITTGTATIPQDSLNAIAVQPYAYFPQFKPQPSEKFQLWSGNLKKYKVVNSILKDKDDKNVFTTTNGELNTSVNDLWVKSLVTTDTELLTLGGVLGKLKLKGNTTNGFSRKVLTNTGAMINSVDETFIKQKLSNRKYLLGLLGYDLTETELNALTTSSTLINLSPTKTLRNMGAIMHSTPVMLTQEGKITYNTVIDTTNRQDYVLFGTTQGVLHVVKAGAESDTDSNYQGGVEEFAFVPEEILTSQPQALLNETESGSGGMNNLYYGVDGPWVAHTEYVYNSTSDKFLVKDGTKLGKQWVYGGLRMGGRSYYALDLTDISAPTIKFRIDPTSSKVFSPNLTGGEQTYTHLAKMGESWSKPVIANVQWQGKRRLVMFVGGGYDRTGGSDSKGYETFNYNQTNKLGAGVFMFDANTGEPLWSTYELSINGDASYLNYSVVSQIKTIDRDGDGDIDHLYFGDLGGQVFRIDLNSTHTSAMTKANFASNIIRILDVHKTDGTSPRFYEAPGFSVYAGTTGNFAVVSIGSGNRSNPLLGKKVNNSYIVNGETADLNNGLQNDAVYNLFDVDIVKKNPTTVSLNNTLLTDLAAVTNANRELSATTSPANKIDFTNKKGWYYSFAPVSTAINQSKAIEKVQGDIIIVDNDLYVSTFDAEAVGTTEACGAGIYGASKAHRFCMPYGQCPNGETVANNTLNLGKGILGITLGGGTNGDPNARSIVAPVSNRNPSSNKLLAALYRSTIKLTPLSWYEKN